MSILKALGIRSTLLSLLEVALFFVLLTPLYFCLLGGIYVLAARPELDPNLGVIVRLAAVMPVWMWAIQIAGYLLLITIYWSPGEAAQDRAELGALVGCLTLAAVGGLAWLELSHGAVSGTIWTFYRIVTGRMAAGS